MTARQTAFAQITCKISPAAPLITAQSLAGGVSAVVTALTIEPATGIVQRLVVRQ